MSCRAIVQECISKLKRNTDWGNHDYSYFAFCGEELFITYVCRQPVVYKTIGSGEIFDDLVDAQRQEVKKVVCWIDRYGLIQTSWLGQQAMPMICLAELTQRLDAWRQYYAPSHPIPSHHLVMALQQACVDYRYEQDLWVWAIPILGAELWQRATLPLKVATQDDLKTVIQNYLIERTAVLLNCLGNKVGICSIQNETVVAQTQLLLLQSGKMSFPSRSELLSWVEARLCDQIKLQIPFYALPNMSHSWNKDASEDACETLIRLRFLEVFGELVRD